MPNQATNVMRLAHRLIVAAAWLVLAAIAEAQVPLTSDLIHFAGGDSSVTLGSERFEIGSDRWYVHLGVMLWTARAGSSLPVHLTLTSRGLAQVLFFEPAPLLDLMLPEREDALRATLHVPLNQELPAGDAASLPTLVAFKRRAVRDQMRAFDLKGLADVVALNTCQQRVERQALTSPDALYDLLSCLPSFPRASRSNTTLMQYLYSRRMLQPILRSEAASTDVPHVVGYVAQVRAGELAGGSTEIYAAAESAREEKTLTINFNGEKEVLQSDAAKLFIPPLFTLLGIGVGGAVGFYFFQKQQRIQFEYFGRQQDEQFQGFLKQQEYQRRQGEAERFQQRKYERFTELREFFQNTYPGIKEDRRVGVLNMRNRMIEDHVYNILPAEAVATLNKICESGDTRQDAIQQIDALLRENFREFMSDPTI